MVKGKVQDEIEGRFADPISRVPWMPGAWVRDGTWAAPIVTGLADFPVADVPRKLGSSRRRIGRPMSETAEIVQQISALRSEHRELDQAIAEAGEMRWADQLELTRMKRRKLRIKDMIAYLENKLIPDLNA